MFGGLPGSAGRLARHFGGGVRGQRKLLGVCLKAAGRAHDLFDDPADLAAEILDELIEFCFAAFAGRLFGAGPLGLELAALDPIGLEDVDGSRDHADLVVAVGVSYFDVGSALGQHGEGFGDGFQRLGDAADQERGGDEGEQGGDTGRDSHGIHRLPQHAVEFGHGDADIDDADDLAGRIEDRLVGRVEAAAEQDCWAFIGFTATKEGLPGVVCGKLGPDRPIAVFFFHVRRSADELVRRFVIDEQGSIAADVRGRPVDNPMVTEFRHPRHFDALDHPVANGDPGVRVGLRKCERQGAKAEIDIALGTAAEVARQRPVPGPNQQCRIDRNQ